MVLKNVNFADIFSDDPLGLLNISIPEESTERTTEDKKLLDLYNEINHTDYPNLDSFKKINHDDKRKVEIKRQAKKMYQSFKEACKVIAARIPAQSMQSYMPMKVVAFDNPDINTAYVSTY